MNTHPLGVQDVHDRLLSLEKQNRRFKQLAVAALLVATLLLVMGQAPATKTVEANEFILRDAGGNVRASLSVDQKTSVTQLFLMDQEGRRRVEVNADLLGGTVALYGNSQDAHKPIHLDEFQMAVLSSGGLALGVLADKTAGMSLSREKLSITDAQGFAARVGVGALVTPSTGETHKTSAASLVLFDKNKEVIWKAP